MKTITITLMALLLPLGVSAEPPAPTPPAAQREIHGYMDRIRPLLPKGWSARVLVDYALCIEHEQSPTRIMLRIGERIGGQEEYRRLLAQREEFLKQWNARFPHGSSMMPDAPDVVLRPPTHFDDRHSVWLQRSPTGPGAEKGMIETKELAAESDTICHSVAKLFTPYDSSPPATRPAFGEPAPTTSPATPASGAAGDGEGLRLQAVLAAGVPVEFLPGQAIPLEMQLMNASRTREYTVVKPGDGSESGWREPHVYYTAERLAAEGRWTPLAPASTDRCKLFDSRWQKDVVTLKPGESLALKEWLPPPSSAFEFQQAGRYRIRVHYAYRGGQVGKGAASRPAEDLGGMKGVEPFEIVSDPVVIAVKRPLNVTLKVRGNLVANQPARLSDLLAIAVANESDKPISAGQPTLSAEGRLTLQMIAPLGWGPTLDKQNNPHAARMDLQPGRSAPLLGAGEFANGLDGSWTYPRAGTVKLRAGYTPSTWKDIGTVWSDWVEVKVVPASTTPAAAPTPSEAQRQIHGYMDRIRPLLPKGWSARVLTDYALCIEHEQSPTRIMLRIGTRIGGQEEYRRLLAQREEYFKQWHARFPHGSSMGYYDAPAGVVNPPTHFDDRHSVWLQRFPTGPGAETGKIETKELAAESNAIFQAIAKLFTSYEPATPPAGTTEIKERMQE